MELNALFYRVLELFRCLVTIRVENLISSMFVCCRWKNDLWLVLYLILLSVFYLFVLFKPVEPFEVALIRNLSLTCWFTRDGSSLYFKAAVH